MEITKKMMLVPAGRPNASIEKMTELDKQMTAILKNDKLSTLEKIKLYHQVLRRNIEIENRVEQNTNVNSSQNESVNYSHNNAMTNLEETIDDLNESDFLHGLKPKKEPGRNSILRQEKQLSQRNLKDLLSKISNSTVSFEEDVEYEDDKASVGQSSPKILTQKKKEPNEKPNRTLHESNILNWKRLKSQKPGNIV